MPEILIVEDEPLERQALKEQLAQVYKEENIFSAQMAQEAIYMVNETKPELVLLDIKLKNSSGFEVAAHIKKEYPNIRQGATDVKWFGMDMFTFFDTVSANIFLILSGLIMCLFVG